ncbi:MAG: iron dicitrate transport regulator FecR [Planctomycetaceae bacterium]|nr:iron dicitrate transport regulator FecR [Planctomycetaceae bacterium]
MTTPDNQQWEYAVDALRRSREVVVFTGAGISAESGIATFRDDDGFWRRFPPEEFANWSGLMKTAATQPRRFGDFLLAILEPIAHAEPNAGHQAIAELEQHVNVSIITQNIDGLHQSAGSTAVKEVHGTLFETVDLRTNRFRNLLSRDEVKQVVEDIRRAMTGSLAAARLMMAVSPLFGLDLKGGHRPNLVLFGDAMAEPAWSQSVEATKACDTFIAVGTSGEVFPAASLPFEAQSSGATVITVDPVESGTGFWLRGTAGEVLPRIVADAFGQAN